MGVGTSAAWAAASTENIKQRSAVERISDKMYFSVIEENIDDMKDIFTALNAIKLIFASENSCSLQWSQIN